MSLPVRGPELTGWKGLASPAPWLAAGPAELVLPSYAGTGCYRCLDIASLTAGCLHSAGTTNVQYNGE